MDDELEADIPRRSVVLSCAWMGHTIWPLFEPREGHTMLRLAEARAREGAIGILGDVNRLVVTTGTALHVAYREPTAKRRVETNIARPWTCVPTDPTWKRLKAQHNAIAATAPWSRGMVDIIVELSDTARMSEMLLRLVVCAPAARVTVSSQSRKSRTCPDRTSDRGTASRK